MQCRTKEKIKRTVPDYPLTVCFLAHAQRATLHVAVGAFTVVAAWHVDALLGAETRSLRALVDVCKKAAVVVNDH